MDFSSAIIGGCIEEFDLPLERAGMLSISSGAGFETCCEVVFPVKDVFLDGG